MSKRTNSIATIVSCLVLIGVVALSIVYKDKIIELSNRTHLFSSSRSVSEIWEAYKIEYLEPGTMRTLDKQQKSITTSEGQSYTMMRAVWMDDAQTFDASWQWTKDNLQRDDKLMSWKFGKLADGTYGIQNDVGGATSASDADTDIAVSLLMAYKRWNEPKYLYDAMPIITAIWQKDVVLVQDKPVLAANDLEKSKLAGDPIIVNPSYFAPYAYKLFAKVDLRNNWNALADNSYDILQQISKAKLAAGNPTGLPANWVEINQATGAITPSRHPNLDTNYGYDAFRTPWRLALDWQWNKDERAKKVLQNYSFLAEQWRQHGKLSAVYSNDGKAVGSEEAPAMYGASLGYFMVMQPEMAAQIYKEKLESHYSLDHMGWKSTMAYYDDNWAWFGLAMYNNKLVDLTK